MDKILCHNNNYSEKLEEVSEWSIKPKEVTQIKAFFKDYELGRITGRRAQNPEGGLLRNLYFLKVAVENIKEDSIKEIETFLEHLIKDKIRAFDPKKKKYNLKPYALRSKKAIIKILSTYLKWKGLESLTKPLNLNLSVKKNDFEILTDEEITKLFEGITELDKKYFFIVLASSGMRAEEFHNIRFEDVKPPEGNDSFVKITIKNQFSKTSGRTISLYDKRCSQVVKEYLSQRIAEGIKPQDPVFPITYNGCRKWLKRLGERILNKDIHYHMFRHSAATRLSSKMNRQQLCIYFGWNFSSPMPDIYIKRAGVNMDEIDNKFSNSHIEELESELEKMRNENKLIAEKIVEILNVQDKILSKRKPQKK